MVNVIQQAIEDIAAFIDQPWSESQDLHRARAALASLRAAQEGDLPPLLTDEQIREVVRGMGFISLDPYKFARAIESEVRTAIAAAGGGVPTGYKLVPIEFLRGFLTLAHNYSLRAEPPDFYRGVEGDAFSNAYRRCGEDLAKLRATLASSPQPEAVPAVAQSKDQA